VEVRRVVKAYRCSGVVIHVIVNVLHNVGRASSIDHLFVIMAYILNDSCIVRTDRNYACLSTYGSPMKRGYEMIQSHNTINIISLKASQNSQLAVKINKYEL